MTGEDPELNWHNHIQIAIYANIAKTDTNEGNTIKFNTNKLSSKTPMVIPTKMKNYSKFYQPYTCHLVGKLLMNLPTKVV